MIVASARSNVMVSRLVNLAAREDEVSERYLHYSNHGILTIIRSLYIHLNSLAQH